MSARKPTPAPIASDIPVESLLLRLREVQGALEAAKPLYSEADALTLELIARGWRGGVMPDGTSALLLDNFTDKEGQPKLTAWKSCGIKRFEIDFTDALTAQKKSRK